MKAIKFDIPNSINEVELHLFADEHIGDAGCDINRLKERIAYVANKENAYCVLNGDILDYASRSSIGDIESRQFNIMEQLETAKQLFEPIKDKIVAIVSGNHEDRAYNKEGIDISRIIAEALGAGDRYCKTAAYIFLRYGMSKKRKSSAHVAKIYMVHGRGGGRKEGAKAIRLADMATICNADIYIHSHTHLPMIFKESYFEPCNASCTLTQKDRLFVNTASNLNYGGYGEANEFKPNSKDTPTIYIKTIRVGAAEIQSINALL